MTSIPKEGAAVCIAPSCPGPTASGIPEDRHAVRARRNVLEQRQPFRPDGIFEGCKPGDVAAGPGETFDKAGADRIAGRRKDDRYGTRRLLERTHSCAPGSDQNIGREHYQFRRVPPNFIDITSSPTIFEL
jgi:hypothetical protein